MTHASRGAKVDVVCENRTGSCQRRGNPFSARVASRARGWDRFCCKSCKQTAQERAAGHDGSVRRERERERERERNWDDDMNSHIFSGDALGQD